jgi:predicted negative regulator of RcsB-dependent stress response
VVVVDSESLEVLFDSLNLTRVKNVLMSAYRLRSAVERVNSRLSTVVSKTTFQGLKAAVTKVSYAMLGTLFVAWTAVKTGKPEKAGA